MYALDCVQTVTAAEPTPAGVMVRLAPSATVDGVAVTPVVSGNAATTPTQRVLAANAASNGGSSPNVAAPNAVWIASSPDSNPPWAAFAAAVSRQDITEGAAELGVDFDEHLTLVIAALTERREDLMPPAGETEATEA